MKIRKFKKDDFLISTDPRKLQIEVIHKFLSNSYWAKGVAFETVKKSVENSFCFGIYKENNQIGFARVITDFTTFAYLADVFILEEFRGLGLSKWLLQVIIEYPELQNIRSWMLKTEDAHGLYKKFGFDKPEKVYRIMEYRPIKK